MYLYLFTDCSCCHKFLSFCEFTFGKSSDLYRLLQNIHPSSLFFFFFASGFKIQCGSLYRTFCSQCPQNGRPAWSRLRQCFFTYSRCTWKRAAPLASLEACWKPQQHPPAQVDSKHNPREPNQLITPFFCCCYTCCLKASPSSIVLPWIKYKGV